MTRPQSNCYEVNVLYNQRIKGVRPYIFKLAKGDDDLIQEGYIGVYNAIKKKPDLKPSYLKAQAQWNMINSIKKGRSVDNGFWKRETLKIIHTDQIENYDLSANILKDIDRKPVDEQVIEKITFETFIGSLTGIEERIVRYRIAGWTLKQVKTKLKLSRRRLEALRREIRFKIKECYA